MDPIETAPADMPLVAEDISRTYGIFQALAPLNLTIQPGEIVALMGANGAGKSTLLQCLSGLLHPSSGRVLIKGFELYQDERQAKQRLAFVPDVPRFYAELTAYEHLAFIAYAHEAGKDFEKRADTLLHDFDLWEARDLFPHNYSRGMRLKLALLMAFIRPFSLLLLDEPTSALDQDSAARLVDRLKDLRHAGAGILLSTHNPEIVQGLADRILHMEHGHLVEA